MKRAVYFSIPGISSLLAATIVLNPRPVFAQAVSVGSVNGQVVDPTGGAIARASVTITETETSVGRHGNR